MKTDEKVEPAKKLAFETREEWLAERRLGIGGSDAPAILGVDPYRSALEVYSEKLGIGEPVPENDRMKWGRRLESVVADAYEEETGRKLFYHGEFSMFISNLDQFIRCSPDRDILPSDRPAGNLQIKTSAYYREAALQEDLPLHWQVQFQHELMVRGFTWGSFAVLLNGNKLLWLDLERNASFCEALRQKEREFWKRVEEHDPPSPDASQSARETLGKLYPRDSGATVVLPPEALKWDERRLKAIEMLKTWEASKGEAENRIRAAIGEATFGVLPNGVKYSWKHSVRKSYVVEESEIRTLRRIDK